MQFLIIFAAKYLYLIIVAAVVLIALLTKREIRRNIAKLSLLALPLSLIIGKIANHLIYNPRPFVVEHVKPLIEHTSDNGFPSDHTLLVMTIAAIIFAVNKKAGVILGMLATIVGTSRVLAHVHHPLDIIGSTLIALIATYFSWYLLRRFKFIS